MTAGAGRAPRLLVVQLTRMGDIAMTLPLLARAKETWPGAEITLLHLAEFGATARLARGADRLVAAPIADLAAIEAGGPALADVVARLRDGGPYDLAVNLTHDAVGAAIVGAVETRQIAGQAPGFVAGELRVLGDYAKYLFSLVSDRRGNLFNLADIQIGMAGALHGPVGRLLDVSEERREEARRLLAARGARPGATVVALQLGAAQRHRAWPPDRYAAAARLVAKRRPDVQWAIVGAPEERDLAAEFASSFGGDAIDLVGATDVPGLAALLGEVALLVSNDTGPIHLAAAAGAKTVGLYFCTAWFSETGPYGAGHWIIQPTPTCAPCLSDTMCAARRCRDMAPPELVASVVLRALGEDLAPLPAPADVAVLSSRFLADGTLAYEPRAGESGWYLRAAVQRHGWRRFLGLDGDRAYESAWRPFADDAIYREWRNGVTKLRAHFEDGLAAANGVDDLYAAGAPRPDDVVALSRRLIEIGRAAHGDGATAPIVSRFAELEMNDIPLVDHPDLAREMARRYRRLAALCRVLLA